MANRSPAALAATAFTKIETLRADCATALNEAPDTIRKRFAKREADIIERLPAEAQPLLEALTDTLESGAQTREPPPANGNTHTSRAASKFTTVTKTLTIDAAQGFPDLSDSCGQPVLRVRVGRPEPLSLFAEPYDWKERYEY